MNWNGVPASALSNSMSSRMFVYEARTPLASVTGSSFLMVTRPSVASASWAILVLAASFAPSAANENCSSRSWRPESVFTTSMPPWAPSVVVASYVLENVTPPAFDEVVARASSLPPLS